MSNKILITYTQLETSKKKFLETSNNIHNLIRMIDSEILALKPAWQGLSSDAFIRHWESKCKKDFVLLQNMSEQFAQKLDIVSNKMKETDKMLAFQMNNDNDILQGSISNSGVSKPVTLPSEGDELVGEIKPMKPSGIGSVAGDLSKPVTLPSGGDELVGEIKPMKPLGSESVSVEISKPVTLPSGGDELVAQIKPMKPLGSESVSVEISKPVKLPI